MNCLHCGDCCRRFSPLTSGVPCPNIKQDGTFFFCSIYENRPDQCSQHKFDCRFCPIGMDFLKLDNPTRAYERINLGYLKLNNYSV